MLKLSDIEYSLWRERFQLNRFQVDLQETVEDYNSTYWWDQSIEEILQELF